MKISDGQNFNLAFDVILLKTIVENWHNDRYQIKIEAILCKLVHIQHGSTPNIAAYMTCEHGLSIFAP